MICQELFWLHLQRVALVTEDISGKEDERRQRRRVKKVGIDPHFAFANMLCDVAWTRAYGTTRILFGSAVDENEDSGPVERSPISQQIAELYPQLDFLMNHRPALTCADCAHFAPDRKWCTYRRLEVGAGQPQCEIFVPRSDEDDDEYD